jgi:Tfp pilus assembly protein PilV
MKNFSRNRHQKGASLIEVLVATGLVAALSIGVLAASGQSMRVTNQADARTAATLIAKEQLEALTSISNGARPAATNKPFAIPESALLSFPNSKAVKVSGTFTIRDVSGKDGLQEVLVRVSWKDAAALSTSTKSSSVELLGRIESRWVTLRGGSTTSDELDTLFVPPPPPPPPPAPVVAQIPAKPGTPGKPSTPGRPGTSGPKVPPRPVNPAPPVPAPPQPPTKPVDSGKDKPPTPSNPGTPPTPSKPSQQKEIEYGGMWG